jgi:hypothetical protein
VELEESRNGFQNSNWSAIDFPDRYAAEIPQGER